jgi:hypothetical protein
MLCILIPTDEETDEEAASEEPQPATPRSGGVSARVRCPPEPSGPSVLQCGERSRVLVSIPPPLSRKAVQSGAFLEAGLSTPRSSYQFRTRPRCPQNPPQPIRWLRARGRQLGFAEKPEADVPEIVARVHLARIAPREPLSGRPVPDADATRWPSCRNRLCGALSPQPTGPWRRR